jgi:hypothetical protein
VKKVLSAATAIILALGLVGPAFAAEPGHLEHPMGQHIMSGTITKIDHQKGTLSIHTAEAPLDLHFPPSAIADLKVGDKVSVQLAISKSMAKEGSAHPSGY